MKLISKEDKTGRTSNKNPTGKTKCQSKYEPVCGSDGKTYGNLYAFNEAKRLSNGKLSLNHEGKC
ncbi:hypothetical protein G4228_006679 [Cervus hanglu yarkandensis]|nr:hypothetical protein G4228_006679 [Cervus hanglu yarkandensis]